jgi:hypothetical protein
MYAFGAHSPPFCSSTDSPVSSLFALATTTHLTLLLLALEGPQRSSGIVRIMLLLLQLLSLLLSQLLLLQLLLLLLCRRCCGWCRTRL